VRLAHHSARLAALTGRKSGAASAGLSRLVGVIHDGHAPHPAWQRSILRCHLPRSQVDVKSVISA